jgi:hypothetical protein
MVLALNGIKKTHLSRQLRPHRCNQEANSSHRELFFQLQHCCFVRIASFESLKTLGAREFRSILICLDFGSESDQQNVDDRPLSPFRVGRREVLRPTTSPSSSRSLETIPCLRIRAAGGLLLAYGISFQPNGLLERTIIRFFLRGGLSSSQE